MAEKGGTGSELPGDGRTVSDLDSDRGEKGQVPPDGQPPTLGSCHARWPVPDVPAVPGWVREAEGPKQETTRTLPHSLAAARRAA